MPADPLLRYLVLGSLGYVGWQWAAAQPAGSWPQNALGQLRGVFKPTPARAAPVTAGPAPAPGQSGGGGGGGGDGGGAAPGAAGATAPVNTDNTVVQQYNQLEAGNWYQVTQWSDGSYTSWLIPPEQWVNYGIPTGGAGGAVEGPPTETGPAVVEKHADGAWWLDIPFTDGSVSSQYIDPSQYVLFGIMQDGSGLNPYPGPV